MFNGFSILIVDDEEDLRDILSDELRSLGAFTTAVSSVGEAQNRLQEGPFDLILSDFRMPGGDGASLLQWVQDKSGSSIKVVFLTGFADLSVEVALSLGADGYLNKPFHFKQLKSLLKRLLLMEVPEIGETSSMDKIQLKFLFPFPQAPQNLDLKVGRGGLSMNIFSQNKIRDKIVELIFEDVVILTQCRWSLGLAEKNQYRMGFEILSFNEALRGKLEQTQPRWSNDHAYIPL
jgi:CheY-like chemotaxis protein